MRYLPYILVVISITLISCSKNDTIKRVSSEGSEAESVYLTHDQNDSLVVVWTENENDKLTLFFATSMDNGQSFSERASMPLSNDVATHPESMPKVAFKKDGTIIATYEKKTPTKDNKHAGAIYYVSSGDGGKSWTQETFLHNDTIEGRSRSYFDIERLPDGEIGASWLDIKLDNETGGRSVRFAKTSPATGFSNEILVDSSACQCCRIDVYADMTGRVNVAYRGVMKGMMGQSIRDMMIATSDNNGESFTPPIRISQDDWAIDGCPHTGPSLCGSKAGLFSFWFTEGNGTGIYYSFKQNSDDSFSQRVLVSNFGRHPQLSANDSRFMMVWEEISTETGKPITRVLYQMNYGVNVKKDYVSPKGSNAFIPVVTQTKDGFLIAFLMETQNGVRMYTSKL